MKCEFEFINWRQKRQKAELTTESEQDHPDQQRLHHQLTEEAAAADNETSRVFQNKTNG